MAKKKQIRIHKRDGSYGLLDQALSASEIPKGKYLLSLKRSTPDARFRVTICLDRTTCKPNGWMVCEALNEEANKLIHCKDFALYPTHTSEYDPSKYKNQPLNVQ